MRFITASMLGHDLLRSLEEMHKACSDSAKGVEPSGSKSLGPHKIAKIFAQKSGNTIGKHRFSMAFTCFRQG